MNDCYQELIKWIKPEDILQEEPMSKHTSFHIGGKADLFIKIHQYEELAKVLKIAKSYQVPIFILGNGTNILVKDGGIRGIVLQIDFQKIEVQDTVVTVGAGVKVPYLAGKMATYSLSGLENLYGIPGTVGGLIRMNGGAYGSEIKDVLLTTTYMDKEGKIHTISNEEHQFSYRHSIFEKNIGVILEAKLQLTKGKEEEIRQRMEENLASRKQNQPLEYPSAGSTFKRGDGFITAKLIDEAELKGYQVGGAEISTKHAGFIVNKGNATAKDVLAVVEHTKQVIKELFHKEIKLEIIVIGED